MGREWRFGKGLSMSVPPVLEIRNFMVFEKNLEIFEFEEKHQFCMKYLFWSKIGSLQNHNFLHKGILYLQERIEAWHCWKTSWISHFTVMDKEAGLLARSLAGFPRPQKDAGSSCGGGSVQRSAGKAHLACLTSGADNFSHFYPLNDKIISSKSHVISSHYFLDCFLQFVNNERLKKNTFKA